MQSKICRRFQGMYPASRSRIYQVILMLFVLMQVLSDMLALDCLQCYQCASYNDDPNPYCDSDYWYTLTVKKKRRYIVGCPEHAGEFCIKKTIFMPGGRRLVERGCIGRHDNNGIELQKGCLILSGDFRMTVCFCTESLCNISTEYAKINKWILIVVLHMFPIRFLIT